MNNIFSCLDALLVVHMDCAGNASESKTDLCSGINEKSFPVIKGLKYMVSDHIMLLKQSRLYPGFWLAEEQHNYLI